MEEAAELGNHLPLSFKTPSEQEYIACRAGTGRSAFHQLHTSGFDGAFEDLSPNLLQDDRGFTHRLEGLLATQSGTGSSRNADLGVRDTTLGLPRQSTCYGVCTGGFLEWCRSA